MIECDQGNSTWESACTILRHFLLLHFCFCFYPTMVILEFYLLLTHENKYHAHIIQRMCLIVIFLLLHQNHLLIFKSMLTGCLVLLFWNLDWTLTQAGCYFYLFYFNASLMWYTRLQSSFKSCIICCLCFLTLWIIPELKSSAALADRGYLSQTALLTHWSSCSWQLQFS